MLNWLKGPRTVQELIARKEFDKAVALAEQHLEQEPKNPRLRLKLADAVVAQGDKKRAVSLLQSLSDEYAKKGFGVKAIALLKKIQRLDPENGDIGKQLAELVSSTQTETMAQRLRRQQRMATLKSPVPTAPSAPAPQPEEEAASPIPKTPLFSDFHPDDLVAVIGGLNLKTMEAGEIIVTEGEPGDSLFVLTEGTVRVYVRNQAGRNLQVREMDEGAFFGEISILAGKPRTATITCKTDCDLLELDRATLDAISEKHPRVLEVLQQFYDQRANSDIEETLRSRG